MTPNSTPVWPCGGTDKCLCGTAQDIRRRMTSLFCLGHLVVHGSWPSWQ